MSRNKRGPDGSGSSKYNRVISGGMAENQMTKPPSKVGWSQHPRESWLIEASHLIYAWWTDIVSGGVGKIVMRTERSRGLNIRIQLSDTRFACRTAWKQSEGEIKLRVR